jgi:hypothetical protein
MPYLPRRVASSSPPEPPQLGVHATYPKTKTPSVKLPKAGVM